MSKALKGAFYRGNVIVNGVHVTIEAAQRNTLESLQEEIITLGGQILGVEEIDALARTGRGERPNRRIFVIDAVLPFDTLPR